MSAHVADQVVHKTVQSKQFALPLNESTDTSNEAQLVAFVLVPEIAETYFILQILQGKFNWKNHF
jgi:hypothetical protein